MEFIVKHTDIMRFKKYLLILMIVGRGEVKSFLFDRNEYTIETAKRILKNEKCNYEPTMKQRYIEKYYGQVNIFTGD